MHNKNGIHLIHKVFLSYIISLGRTFGHYKTHTILNQRLLWILKPKRFPMILRPEKWSQNLRQANNYPPGPRRWFYSVQTWRNLYIAHCPICWDMAYGWTLSRRLLIHFFSLLWEAMLLWKAQWAGKLMKWHTNTCAQLQSHLMISSPDNMSLMKHSPPGPRINTCYLLLG